MSKTEIVSVIGRQVLDSRGNPTVEAEVQLSGGVACTAISPSGASTGKYEALELRDGDMQLYGGKSVLQACKNISGAIHNALRGMDADNLFAVDQALIALDGTKNKAVLGANATLAVSMACAKAAACAQGVALFRFLGGTEAVDRYIAGLGIGETVIVADEEMMHRHTDNQYLNRTTPLAAVRLLERFRRGELLSAAYGDFLLETMFATETGPDKLRGLLPADVAVAHKTGSSDRDGRGVKIADNDLGYVELPDGSGYAICVYVAETALSDRETAALIAEISRLVWQRLSAE